MDRPVPASLGVSERPKSDVSSGVGLVGLLVLVAWVLVCRSWVSVAVELGIGGPMEPLAGPYAALVALLLSSGAMVLWSVAVNKVHRRATTGIDWASPRPWREVFGISAVKLVGLWATWAVIGAAYCLFRFYWQEPWIFAIHLIGVALVPMVLLSIPYVLWLDRVLVDPRDGAWHCGAWIMGRSQADPREVILHARRWAVKGFFTTFMLSILPGGFSAVVRFDTAGLGDPVALANWLITWLFMIDVQIGTAGYLFTLKPLDSHIRSANPHLDGWVAALVCYPPFIMMGGNGPLDYHPGTAEWSQWMAGHSWALWGWGAWLVLLTGVYAWATVVFGLRFSNLTYRGVITHGPYRLTRHPAYVAKNLFWWSVSLPFLSPTGSMVDCIRNTAILAMVSAVYWWRAKTEERHLLAEDAKYRQYWAWAETGAPVTRLLKRLI